MALVRIPVDKVRLGMFIHLDVGWWKHPFVTNAFRLTADKQLKILRGLKLKTVLYDPSVPRETPVILDLSEEGDLKIVGSLRPAKADPAAVAYLQPGRMLGFFVSDKKKPA